jgi:hypothetical protein
MSQIFLFAGMTKESATWLHWQVQGLLYTFVIGFLYLIKSGGIKRGLFTKIIISWFYFSAKDGRTKFLIYFCLCTGAEPLVPESVTI